MPKGKRINSTSKQIICNVYDYSENESKKSKGSVLPKLGKKTSEATGYCKRTVEQIIVEKQNLLHQRSDTRRADYALLWMILIVMPFDVLFMNFMPRKNTPL